ncbi:hypothetical protein JW977_01635 [Candidatus Falkowbacteria bacterium]|nr:hypothetical protein [Candidatus Falkowbacteria bacterium]
MAELAAENLTDEEQALASSENKKYQAQTQTEGEEGTDFNEGKPAEEQPTDEGEQTPNLPPTMQKENLAEQEQGEARRNIKVEKQKISAQSAQQPQIASFAGGVMGVGDAVNMAGQMATAKAMIWAWNTIYDISFTILWFGLLYLNGHFIMKYIVGDTRFCEFGDEWTFDAKAQIPGWLKNSQGTTALKWGEIIGLFLLDVIIFIIIMLIITILFMVASGYKVIIDVALDLI